MKKLQKYFPFVSVVFTTENGISSSAAAFDKDANKEKANRLLENVNINTLDFYNRKTTFYSDTRGFEVLETPCDKTFLPAHFGMIAEVAKLYSGSAILGFGIRKKNDLFEKVKNLSNEEIALVEGFEAPAYDENKFRVAPVAFNINRFVDLKRIEDMFDTAPEGLLVLISEYYADAMKAESEASVYCNQLNEGSTLRRIAKAETQKPTVTTTAGNLILEQTHTFALDKITFAKVEDDIRDTYQKTQQKVNGYMKQIKDAARKYHGDLLAEFNKKTLLVKQELKLYQQEQLEFSAKCDKVRSELSQEVAELQIVKY